MKNNKQAMRELKYYEYRVKATPEYVSPYEKINRI